MPKERVKSKAKSKVKPKEKSKEKPKARVRRLYALEVPSDTVPVVKVYLSGEEIQGVRIREIPESSLAEALVSAETWAERNKRLVSEIKAVLKQTTAQWTEALESVRTRFDESTREVTLGGEVEEKSSAPAEVAEEPSGQLSEQSTDSDDETPSVDESTKHVADLQKLVVDFTRSVEALREMTDRQSASAESTTKRPKE